MAPFPTLVTPSGVEQLVLRYRPLARHLAQRYVRATDQREDLEQVAYLGLVKAAQRFDPARGNAFTTFAVPTILGELRRHCRDTRWAWHVPRPVQERVQALRRLEDQWQSHRGRPPSASEAARALACAEEDIIDARLAAATLAPESLNARAPSADGTIGEAIDRLGHDERGYEAAERRDSLSRALARLDEPARRALHMRAEMDMTTPQIAACLGLSASQAGRLIAKGLRCLRAALEETEQVPASPQRAPAVRRLPQPQRVGLADVFPELLADLSDAEREEVRRRVIARRIELPRGARLRAGRGVHLVLSGTLARAHDGTGRRFGPGAVVRAGGDAGEPWQAVERTALAVLDGSLLRTLCRWPALVAALLTLPAGVSESCDAPAAA